MTPSQIRTYNRNRTYQRDESAGMLEIIEKIPTLTKIGAICLVMGKFIAILAITAAFIPSLNMLAVPLIIMWGSMVFISVALCSIDHFRKRKLETNEEKMDTIAAMIEESPQLRDQLLDELNQQDEESAVIIPLAVGKR